MKNGVTFPLLIGLLVSLLFLPNAFSEDTVVRVAPHALKEDSDPRIVDIVIENGQNVAGYQVKLEFDSFFMKYTEIDHGDYLPKAVFSGEPKIIDRDPNDPNNTLKVILFAVTSIAGEGNGNGVLTTLKFDRENSGASDLILLDETLLSNRAGELSFPRLENSRTHLNGFADLTVESVQAKPKNTAAREQYHYNKGEEFDLHATVRNIGNWNSASPTLQLYGPSDIATEKGDSLGAPVNIEQLKPNRAVDISLPVVAREAVGVYYYTVCIENDEGWNRAKKQSKDNNCYTLKITVEELPDLVVKTVTASKTTLAPGDPFTLTTTLKNEGLGQADAPIYYRWHRATHPDIHNMPGSELVSTGAIEEVGETSKAVKRIELISTFKDAVPPEDQQFINEFKDVALAANQSSDQSITITAPQEPGTYYYHVCVETDQDESDTENNCSNDVKITVDDHGNTWNDATQLDLNDGYGSLTGVIETEEDVDYFKVEVPSNGELTVYTTTTGDLDTFGTLKQNHLIIDDANSGDGSNFRIVHDVSPQTYYVKVTAANHSTGSYIIHASFTPDEDDPGNTWTDSQHGLTLEDQFTDIAVTENATYFVWEPGLPKVRPGNTTIPYISAITLDISPHDDNGALPNIESLDALGDQGTIPDEYPYFIVQIDGIPMKDWKEAGDIFTWSKVFKITYNHVIDKIKEKIIGTIEKVVDSAVKLLQLVAPTWGTVAKVLVLGSKLFYPVFVDARDLIAQENAAKELILTALHDPAVVIEDYEVFGIRDSDNSDNRTPRYLVMIPKALEELKIKMKTYYFAPEVEANGNVRETTRVSILKNQRKFPLSKGELDLFWSRKEQHIRLHLPDGAAEGKSLETLFEYWIENNNNWYKWGGEYNSSDATELDDDEKNYIKAKLQLFLDLWEPLITTIHTEDLNSFVWKAGDSHPVLALELPNPQSIGYEEWKYTPQLQSAAAESPHARTMSLADYPPFQQLPPEVQAYILQHFEGHANHKAINAEAWQVPETTSLLPNYPNPFNPETWIPYQLSEPAEVKLTIYDINGRIVRDLDLGHQRAGIYHSRARAAHWDGRNTHGEPVASGIYFYTLKAGEFSATRKMLIRK